MLETQPKPGEAPGSPSSLETLHYSTEQALSSWEVTPAYPIATQKKLLAPVVVFLKRIFRFWARIAVGPIIRKQSIFNRHVASALSAIRKEALARRAQEKADEEDLCSLSESMTDPDESVFLYEHCVSSFKGSATIFILGACPRSLAERLQAEGIGTVRVSACDSWNIDGPKYKKFEEAPTVFLERISENTIESILVTELSFWLRPERLLRVLRGSYLALKPGGSIAILVRSFASGSPLSPWCSKGVVCSALENVGFTNVKVTSAENEGKAKGFVASAQKVVEE